MTISYTHQQLAAGTRFDVLVTFSLETGATITSAKAALIDKLPGVVAVTEITEEVAGTLVSGTQYQFTFTTAETEKLLRTTADKNSALKYQSVFLAVLVTGVDGSSNAKDWAFYSNEIQASSSVLS